MIWLVGLDVGYICEVVFVAVGGGINKLLDWVDSFPIVGNGPVDIDGVVTDTGGINGATETTLLSYTFLLRAPLAE